MEIRVSETGRAWHREGTQILAQCQLAILWLRHTINHQHSAFLSTGLLSQSVSLMIAARQLAWYAYCTPLYFMVSQRRTIILNTDITLSSTNNEPQILMHNKQTSALSPLTPSELKVSAFQTGKCYMYRGSFWCRPDSSRTVSMHIYYHPAAL
jgi:hypothetical protein